MHVEKPPAVQQYEIYGLRWVEEGERIDCAVTWIEIEHCQRRLIDDIEMV